MADSNPDRSNPSTITKGGSGPSYEDQLAASLPPQVSNQPDPMLQMSTGRLGTGGIALVAIAIVVIVGVVFYGLNSPGPATPKAPPAASSSATPPAALGAPAPSHGKS